MAELTWSPGRFPNVFKTTTPALVDGYPRNEFLLVDDTVFISSTQIGTIGKDVVPGSPEALVRAEALISLWANELLVNLGDE